MEISFNKKVSKGSRFNQIYIPKEMEKVIEVGDLVQVRLLEKKTEIYYKNQIKLSDFKEYLIKNIFSNLQVFREIKNIFIVGSFLYDELYNDIDLIITTYKKEDNLEKNLMRLLTEKFNQKFHILLFDEQKLKILIERDPIINAMFEDYISNIEIDFDYKRVIDKDHIEFLLMMPEDLLEIEMPSKIFYDNLRRLIAIECFLKNQKIGREKISDIMGQELDNKLLDKIKNNETVNNKEIELLRGIIKKKIKLIRRIMKNGKKK